MFIRLLKHIYYNINFFLFFLYNFLYTLVFGKKNINELFDLNKNYILLFTHNLGGGTESFTKRYISEHKNVIRISNFLYVRKDFFILQIGKVKIFYRDTAELFSTLITLNLCSLIINSLVTYYSIEKIINEIIEISVKKKIQISYMVHDFHAVCPTINLVYDANYCHLRCKEKLCKFSLFNNFTNVSIEIWRSMWVKLFSIVNEIRVFSNSSRDIFIRAYPEVDSHKITVIPHDMSYFKYEAIDTIDFPLNIGIFGNCSTIPKGKLVINDFIKYCKNKDVKIFLAGKYRLTDKIHQKNVIYLGRYVTSEMRDIIIRNKISVILFPSICPETFSYLVSELILLNMPIVSFNFGAQSEKVKQYKNGLICNDMDDEIIFQSLNSIHSRVNKQ